MIQPLFTEGKVNNEIELCEINSLDCKQLIEKALLKSRISYYVRWVKPTLFHRNKNTCIICVNASFREAAEDVVHKICDESGFTAKFLNRKSQNDYL